MQGQGIVVGLAGTGDGNLLSTRRSIGTLLEKMGNPLGPDGLKELKDFKNVALVVVTATIPAAGARQGDKIDCVVSSLGSAKSLKGGRLLQTALTGPGRPPSLPVYAFAQGSVELEDADHRDHRPCVRRRPARGGLLQPIRPQQQGHAGAEPGPLGLRGRPDGGRAGQRVVRQGNGRRSGRSRRGRFRDAQRHRPSPRSEQHRNRHPAAQPVQPGHVRRRRAPPGRLRTRRRPPK